MVLCSSKSIYKEKRFLPMKISSRLNTNAFSYASCLKEQKKCFIYALQEGSADAVACLPVPRA
jgi:hypothetical protein